jgi:hypothetical protein
MLPSNVGVKRFGLAGRGDVRSLRPRAPQPEDLMATLLLLHHSTSITERPFSCEQGERMTTARVGLRIDGEGLIVNPTLASLGLYGK